MGESPRISLVSSAVRFTACNMRGVTVAAVLVLIPAALAHEHGICKKGDKCSGMPNSVCTYSPEVSAKYVCTCDDGYAKDTDDQCTELPSGQSCSPSNYKCKAKKNEQCLVLHSNDTKCVCKDGFGRYYDYNDYSYECTLEKPYNWKDACKTYGCPANSTCYNYAY